MPPEIPSLAALQAFDAARRHRSFSRAAAELGRTQGAISRQVAALERQFGVALFERDHPRVRPTGVAERFGAQVRIALERLAAATVELHAAAGTGGVLHLAILPTFGTRWLIPRMPAFYGAHADVAVHLTSHITPFDFDAGDVDAAIHYGGGVWAGARVEHLMDEEVAVVGAPALLRAHPIASPADVAAAPLLQLDSRPGAWERWFAAADVEAAQARRGARFEHHLMVVQAALAGLGLGLVPAFLVREELASRQLVEPLPGARMKNAESYWLAYPERSRELPALLAFRRWLQRRLRRERLR